jgi:hypothetical protein
VQDAGKRNAAETAAELGKEIATREWRWLALGAKGWHGKSSSSRSGMFPVLYRTAGCRDSAFRSPSRLPDRAESSTIAIGPARKTQAEE